MPGLDPGIHDEVQIDQTERWRLGAVSWIAGSSPRLSGLILMDEVHGMDSSMF
jgi:hypothetical protein